MALFGNKGFKTTAKSFLFGTTPEETGFQSMPEDPSQAAARREGYDTQRTAISQFKNLESPEQSMQQQMQLEKQQGMKASQGRLADIRRRTQELMAQRGMRGTSAGLGSQIAAERNIQDETANIAAQAEMSLPERIRQLKEERILRLNQMGQGMAGSAGQQQFYQNARQGGFLPYLIQEQSGIAKAFAGGAGKAAAMGA